MLNREFYEKDPRTNILLNNGVAKVTTGQSDPEIDTLRYEVSNFVCDGQYADGLKRILTTYLGNLDKSEQPGVWVSGFYGSGKSRLVKMLQHLWIDYEFPDGAKARGLAKLPTQAKELLKELSTVAKRSGGLHAAAGTLGSGAGDSVRLELLGIIFKSVGLPEQYASANFVMWLRHEGLEEAVRHHLEKAGRDFDMEVANLYVSDSMAKAILAERSGFAGNTGEVKILLEKLHFGSTPPATSGPTIPVWIRDGWEVEENTVLSDARAAGDTEAMVFGFIPRSQAEELKQAIANHYAAKTTLDTKGSQNTPEGMEARKAMETRQDMAEKTRNILINDILNETAIYLAGGDEVKGSILLEDKVQDRQPRVSTACSLSSIRPTRPTGTK